MQEGGTLGKARMVQGEVSDLAVRVEGQVPGHHLVENQAEGVKITPRIDALAALQAARLLWRGVARLADESTHAGKCHFPVASVSLARGNGARDAEVDDLGLR